VKTSGALDGICRALAWVGGLGLLVMTVWTVVDVITRYLLAKPLSGSIDLVEVMLVLVVFLALPDCFRREEQVTVDVVDQLVGGRTVASLKLFSAVATLAFLGLLAYTGIQPLMDAWRFGDRKPDLPIPIAWLQLAIEIALFGSLVVLAGQCCQHVRRALGREAP
jgi:TRAP-type C4-dicarboxylate transport system permease small subunit